MDAELAKQLGRIEGTLDRFIATEDAHNERVDNHLTMIDGRLRDVEKKSAVAGAVVGGVTSLAVSLIAAFLLKK